MATKFIVLISIVAVGYLAFGSTTSVSIDLETCEPKGFIANVRRGVTPQGFYKDQIKALDSAVLKIYRTKQVRDKVKNYDESISPTILANTNKKMEEIYQKHPSLRPTDKEIEAQWLREKADKLEEQALDDRLDQIAFKRIDQYENCTYNLSLRLK